MTVKKAVARSFGLIGPNGSGKTRLLKGLRGECISLEQTEAFVGAHKGKAVATVCGGVGSAKAREFIVRFGLVNAWTKKVENLSSGELRKLTCAVVMAKEPEVILMDGVYDGLDPKSRNHLAGFIGNIANGLPPLLVDLGGHSSSDQRPKKKIQAKIVLVGHRIEEIPRKFDKVLALEYFSREEEDHQQQGCWINRDEINFPATKNFLNPPDFLRDHCPPPQKELVQFQNVSVFDKEQVLMKNLNLQINGGEFWVICGNNGAGKSLLTRLMTREEDEWKEDLEIQGKIHRNCKIAIVSVKQHLHYLHSRKIVGDLLQGDEEICQRIGLDLKYLKRPFSSLSVGEQRFVLIARALLKKPDLLIADEISHGLDFYSRQRVMDILDYHLSKRFCSIVLITHYADEIPRQVNHMLHIQDGKIKYGGPACRKEILKWYSSSSSS